VVITANRTIFKVQLNSCFNCNKTTIIKIYLTIANDFITVISLQHLIIIVSELGQGYGQTFL